jgi:predicted SprT family Zn-dependent metalloprotease
MDRTAGTAKGNTVKLSLPVFTDPDNTHDFEDTVLHEIAHILAGPEAGHGRLWKRIAREIGCSAQRCHKLKVRPKREVSKVFVYCNKCGIRLEVTKTRRTRMMNGTTNKVMHKRCGGRFEG